ncbi:MAG: ATP-binding protein [Gemmatimonadaceae bacterium]
MSPFRDAMTDSILAGIVTISADAIICVDEKQRIIFFNDGAEEIFGYDANEVMGLQLEILIPQRFRRTHASHVQAFGESSIPARKMGQRGKISGLRKNGEEFPAEAAISHMGDPGHQIFSVVLRDVTERLRAHEIQQFLAEAGETLSSSLGPEDTLRNVTRLAVPRLADACTVDVYHGERFRGVAAAHREPDHADYIEKIRSEQPIDIAGPNPIAQAIRTQATLTLSDSDTSDAWQEAASEVHGIFESRPAAAMFVPLIGRGQIIGVMSLYREKTQFDTIDTSLAEDLGRRAALAIDNARLHELVRSGIRARDDMIGIVSHDLRNPVNAVRMLTGVMLSRQREEPLPPEMAEYTGVIRQAVEQMDALIRDLLDVTRVEAGRLKVSVQKENTEELLSDSLRTLAPVAEQKSIQLRLVAPDDLPEVIADRERITQVFSNLVGNAVKFSPPGGRIIVRVKPFPNEIVFSISDKGQGMTVAQLSHAFDRFWQSSRTDRQGAGLGLAITKGIIDAHGGRIWAESKLGAGSTFYFTLPTA